MNVQFSYQQAEEQQEEWTFFSRLENLPNWIHKLKGILYDKPKKEQQHVVIWRENGNENRSRD